MSIRILPSVTPYEALLLSCFVSRGVAAGRRSTFLKSGSTSACSDAENGRTFDVEDVRLSKKAEKVQARPEGKAPDNLRGPCITSICEAEAGAEDDAPWADGGGASSACDGRAAEEEQRIRSATRSPCRWSPEPQRCGEKSVWSS